MVAVKGEKHTRNSVPSGPNIQLLVCTMSGLRIRLRSWTGRQRNMHSRTPCAFSMEPMSAEGVSGGNAVDRGGFRGKRTDQRVSGIIRRAGQK